MTAKKRARRTSKKVMGPHQPEKVRCLAILRQLSAYIDDELPEDICAELRRHLGGCPNCEVFIASLRQTVSLCRHKPTPPLSAADRADLRQAILRAAAAER